MPVNFFNEEVNFTLTGKRKLKKWIKETAETELVDLGNINIIFTSDQNILRINNQYLSHNYFTDIIAFNYCEINTISGDLYISIDTVKNNSHQFNVLFSEEIHRVIIHGVLHLIGYNDKNSKEKAVMREKENVYLDRLKNLS